MAGISDVMMSRRVTGISDVMMSRRVAGISDVMMSRRVAVISDVIMFNTIRENHCRSSLTNFITDYIDSCRSNYI